MAIAFGNYNNATAGAGNVNIPLTTSGSNVCVVAFVGAVPSDTVTSVTWNGNAMTKIGVTSATTPSSIAFSCYIYPNAGAASANVTVTTTGGFAGGVAAWYTGCSTTQPDAFTNASAWSTSTGNAMSQNITTVANNSWVVIFGQQNNGTWTGGSGITARETAFGNYGDSNGAITPAGLTNVNLSGSGASGTNYFMALSLAPFAASTTNSNFLMFM